MQEILEVTTNGKDLYITPKGTAEGQQKAVLVFEDIPTCTGIVHTVSQVLVPVDVTVQRIGERDDKAEGTGKPVWHSMSAVHCILLQLIMQRFTVSIVLHLNMQ
jgi:hypothetical protein